jgi:hypothetical protein
MSASALAENVRRQLAALDEAAFEALANRGLLRRARKDLESASIAIMGETAHALQLQVGACEVTLPDTGPVQARCTCPAAGICQHILSACLWLRDQPAGEPTAAPAMDDELLAITPEQMEAWAGRAVLRAAFGLAAEARAEIVAEGAVAVMFRALNATCRFVPGGGLAGAIVTGSAKETARLTLAALLAFQKSRGVDWPQARSDIGTTLAEGSGAPRSREEILASAGALICETLNGGLARASAAVGDRLATLSVSALAVNLPRLALALRGLAQEFRLSQARDGAADNARTFAHLARTYALCTALETAGSGAPAPLIGWHRTIYSDIGHLDLAGVSAWPWETASGYRGLTVLFWDPAAQSWNTWSEARPRHIDPGYDPRLRFGAAAPWAGAESPAQLSRARFRLMNARRNPVGRLSASAKSRAAITGPANPLELGVPIRTLWAELSGGTMIGLADTNPLQAIHAIRPAAWGERFFNPTTQTLQWLLSDAAGTTLLLELRFTPYEEPAIKFFEAFEPPLSPGAVLIGRVSHTPGGFVFHPYSLVEANGTIRHPALDQATSTHSSTPERRFEELNDDFEGDEQEEESASDARPSPISRLLAEVEDLLTALSEGGASSLTVPRRADLARLARRASSLGWQVLPAALVALSETASFDPALLLRCRYECQLHQQALDS